MSDLLCKTVRRRFPALLNGELQGEKHAECIEHLLACSECTVEFRRLKETWDTLSEIPELTPAPDFVLRLRKRIEGASARRRSSFTMVSVRHVAALLTAIVLGTAAGNALARRTEVQTRREKGASIYMLWEPLTAVGGDPLAAAYIAYFSNLKENSGVQ